MQTLKENIGSYFQGDKYLSKKQLVGIIRENHPEFADSTINMYLSKLKKEGILNTVSRGVYYLGVNLEFKPNISKSLKKTYSEIMRKFPFINCCVGDTLWLNDFMVHQPFKNFQYIEVEKDTVESVFNFLSEQSKLKTYLYSDKEIFDKYITEDDNVLIVKNLVSEAPLICIDKIKVPSIEKLLVDMLADTELFLSQQTEKENIINNTIDAYPVNLLKMMRYAQRRNRKEELENLLNIRLSK